MINVTKSFLPPLAEYITHLEGIWKSGLLTNRGQLILELESKLKKYLGIDDLLLTTNGTLPMQIALKILGSGSEVITTPFSYVATTSSIVWEGLMPVFVDIEKDYLTIDAGLVEEAITDNTRAILATHVFGNPCDVEALEEIGRKHNIPVIYDGAHAFGVNYKGKSIFNYGDVSTCSFHATKLFHTAEGGALITKDTSIAQKVFYSHNFGHNGPLAFHGVGINAKMSELQAALGLALLPYIDNVISSRKQIVDYYNQKLDFDKIRRPEIRPDTNWNYSYYPVIFNSEAELLKVTEALNQENIIPRRYFYPSLNTLPYVAGCSMPISESTASRVLCLPLYVGLENQDLDKICEIVNNSVWI